MVIHQHYGKTPHKPGPPNRWSAAGIAVAASILLAGIALFTGHGAGILAIVYCLIVAFLHANAVEPGKYRAPIATGFLAASALVAAFSAIAGATGVAIQVAGFFVTALYGAGLVLGVLARLSWFHRIVALLTAVALVAALAAIPSPPPQTRHDPNKARVDITVVDAAFQPVAGAAVACSVLNVNTLEDADTALLRNKLGGDFARTDAEGRVTIELDATSDLQFYVCGAAMPNTSDAPATSPPKFSDPHAVPPFGFSMPLQIQFDPAQ